jgi:hypothetical protein
MLRSVLGIIAGLITAMLLIRGLEAAGMLVFPPSAGVHDLSNLVTSAPMGKKAWVVIGWALASFVGGWVAARISRLHHRFAALSVAVLIMVGTVMNAMVIPHPMWMNVLGVALPVPLALLGARFARPRSKA